MKETGPAVPGHGKGPPRVSAGSAGLIVLREGWQPVRGETPAQPTARRAAPQPGPEAKDLGLVDSVGTLDEYVSATWGMRTYDFGPSAQSLQLLGHTLQDALVGSVQRLATSVPSVR